MKTFLIIAFFFTSSHLRSEVLSIPMTYTAQPAKDLVDDTGKSLSIKRVKEIWKEKGDLSQLNPKESDIWKNKIGVKLTSADDDFLIDKEERFHYIDKVISTVGVFRFVVRESGEKSLKRNFNIWVSKDNRSILLRKNLLRKLGYKAPKVLHQKKVKIKFKGRASMKAFLEEMQNATFADSDRWHFSTDEKNNIITLQDTLIFESNSRIYNLSMGDISSDTIRGRRVLNALSLAFSLVDVRESVDGLPWSLGRIDNKVAIFDIISGDAFSTTYYDALWMIKRLSKLAREDFQEIVKYAYFPDSVGLLLVEKLSSRFNSVQKLYVKNGKVLPVDYEISDTHNELVRGRLTKDSWEGHGARYSFDDTESPLSKDEMGAYFKSKIYSGIIENLISYVNTNFLYETDIQQAAIDRAIDAQQKQFKDFFKTGEFKRVPFSAWAIPTAKGHIAASRDIITGAYLGTDNLIQIADTVELIGEVGVFVGTLGLPVEAQLYASGSARFSRAYTHVKSIKSIKKALKEPFRNILVPRVKRKKSQTIIQMIDSLQSKTFSTLSEEDRDEEINEIFKEFNKVLEIGDSLIISNNLITSGTMIGGYRFPVGALDMNSMLQLSLRRINLWRLHITRVSEGVFQVYKSKVKSFGRGVGFQVKALLPIFSLNWDRQTGRITTKFHSIEFDKKDERKKTINKLVQLRQVFVDNSTELMNKSEKPFIIQHDFNEQTTGSRFFTRQTAHVNLLDKLKIYHPENYVIELYIQSVATRKGRNYMQVAYDLINGGVEELLDNDNISVSNTESGNPGDSFYGESFSRKTHVEIPFNHEESEIPFENYSEVKSLWKGWSAGKEKIHSIKKEIEKKYGGGIFNDELLYDTDQIKLYSVETVLSLYNRGIEHLVDYNHKQFMKIIQSKLVLNWPAGRSHYVRRGHGSKINRYRRERVRLLRKIRNTHLQLSQEYYHLMLPGEKSNKLTFLIDTLEEMLPFDSFQKLIGGDENFYLKGSINGFRVGTENGEEIIISQALGEYGSEFTGGILDTLKDAIKISQGELGAFWFLRRIQ